MRPRTKPFITALLGAVAVLLMSNTAFATWSSFEYRTSSGYRYGIRDGSSVLKLDLKKRKHADKAAKGMNKADDIEERDNDNGGTKPDEGGEEK